MDKPTVHDIFLRFYPGYLEKYSPSPVQSKVANCIINCKTGAYGANISICEDCGHIQIHYNSCRNRCCPMCQALPKEMWMDKRREDVLDAPYFHVVFTVPQELNPLIYSNQQLLYDTLYHSVSATINELTADTKHLGARVLTLACSLVKKDRKMEEWNVALDKNQKDRNYLYGRLLAVADRIEYRTYDDGDKARVTNAKRYMSTFSQRPFETWKVIEENIQPYMNKLGIAERRFYENLLNDIYELFEIDSFKDNKKLDGLYLLGFHSQAYDLKLKKEDSKEKEEEE